MKLLSNISLCGWTLQASKPSRKNYKIAVLTSAYHAMTKSFKKGFIETLEKTSKSGFVFEYFDGESCEKTVKYHAKNVIKDGYDLVFVVGMACTETLVKVAQEMDSNIPIVSVAVPIEDVDSYNYENITGVAGTRNFSYENYISLLCALKKDLGRVLYITGLDPEHPSNYTEKIRQESTQKSLEKFGSQVSIASPENITYIKELLSSQDSQIDTVFMDRDNSTLLEIETLSKLCSENGITLVSTDLNSVTKGASIGFGSSEEHMAQEAGYKALMVLEKSRQAKDIPFSLPNTSYRIRINPKAMKQQGLHIDPDLLASLGQIEFA